MLFASWYLRVNLTFPMNSKLEQRFDKMRQGRDKVTCRTFICLSIQQIFEGCLLRASPVLRHKTGQGMWPRDRALALCSSAEGFLRMSSLLSFNSAIPLSCMVRTSMMDLELPSDWWELSSLSLKGNSNSSSQVFMERDSFSIFTLAEVTIVGWHKLWASRNGPV